MIYAIGDLHLDFTKEKSMDIFGENWINHEEKIFRSWRKLVTDNDLVLIPGDISWALKLEEAYDDLVRIDKLPGKKILTKGNHDYWWEGPKKLKSLGLDSISFLQNKSVIYNNIGIYGTRGWISKDSPNFKENDLKIYNRELNRLKLSLESSGKAKLDKKIVMLHYPPFNTKSEPNDFVDLMKEFDVDICIYGHLHAEGHKFVKEGLIDGIEFLCVSSDYLDFKLKKIC